MSHALVLLVILVALGVTLQYVLARTLDASVTSQLRASAEGVAARIVSTIKGSAQMDVTWRGERIKKTGTTTVRYEARTTIDRPIGDVFARLADLDGYGTWMHRTGLFRRSGQTSDGPLGPGTAYFDATRMGTFRGQITDYQPPSRIGFRETLRWFGSDLMEARPEYFLEADGGQDDRSSHRGG